MKHAGFAEKLIKKRKESLNMIRLLVRFMKFVNGYFTSSTCTFEWPKNATGWVVEEVIKAFKVMGLQYSTCFQGCSLGLTNTKGDRLHKSWRVKSTSESYINFMAQFTCSKDHKHAVVQGSETV